MKEGRESIRNKTEEIDEIKKRKTHPSLKSSKPQPNERRRRKY